MKHEKPKAERLHALLQYNAYTGDFTRKIDLYACNGRVKVASVGEVAGTWSASNGWIVSVDGKQYKAHHLAWVMCYGVWPTQVIDHMDGDRRNNRQDNLRDVTTQLNAQNQRKATAANKSSGLLGVSATKSRINPWKAQIRVNERITHLGSFRTKEEAHLAYVTAKRTYHEGCTL